MLKVGLTGGIGCGKSTVAQEFAGLGVPCFISDIVAAGYYSDFDFCQQLVKILGQDIVEPDGCVNKRSVADIIFADADKMRAVNALIHPRVLEDFDYWCHLWKNRPYVLFECAILYEYQLEKHLDAVIAVHASLEERLSRLQIRDKATISQLQAVMNAQMPSEEKMRRADYVILNYEGNPRSRQVEYIHNLLSCRAANKES